MGVSLHVIPICTCIDHDDCWILVESYMYLYNRKEEGHSQSQTPRGHYANISNLMHFADIFKGCNKHANFR